MPLSLQIEQHGLRGADWRKLDRARVDIWHVELDYEAKVVAAFHEHLTEDERARAARFHFAIDRNRYIVARGTLRLILAAYLDEEPSCLRFSYNSAGKPALASPVASGRLSFNVSHSDRLALLAVASERAVGIDIERIRNDIAIEDIVMRFLPESECKRINSLGPEEKLVDLFQLWTQREARIKGDGTSLNLDGHEPPGWNAQPLMVEQGYAGALAYQGDAPRIEYRNGGIYCD